MASSALETSLFIRERDFKSAANDWDSKIGISGHRDTGASENQTSVFARHDFAVPRDAEKSNNNSFASAGSSRSFSRLTMPLSASISSQNTASSASSTTTPSLAMNSALERASPTER